MSAFPRLPVVIRPDSETVATEKSLEFQLSTGFASRLPRASSTVAYNWAVSPIFSKRIRVVERFMAIGFWRTTTDTVAVNVPERAIISVEPFAIDVTRPVFETVTT